jgi:RNA polymerase sigma factor for flagellar operon FliA
MESQMKQVRSSEAVFSDSDAVLLEDTLTEDSVATIDMLIASESREKVQEAITQLSDREREILEGYYFDGKNLRQIGVEMGVTESRVCQIRKTALESIRKILSIA